MLKKLLALVLAGAMVLGSVSMAYAEETGGTEGTSEGGSGTESGETSTTKTGTITINSPIIGAEYYAYQIFKMTMNDDTNPTGFSYTISKDDPFFDAVWDYTNGGEDHLILTGITSTLLETPEGDNGEIKYAEYTVTAADDFKDDSSDNGVQAFGKAMETYYNGLTEAQKAEITEYKPTYEDGKNEVTTATATSITFENLPYGYYLITNKYDEPDSRLTVKLELGNEGETGYQHWDLTKDSTEGEIEDAAEEYANAKYPDLDAAQAYVVANPSLFEKTWEEMSNNERAQVLKDLQDTTKADAIAKVNAAIAAAESDDNAQPGNEEGQTGKARLIFIDSTTPNGVINEKNEYEKWDVPVNPDGHADLPDVPEHDEPKGGKNIIVREDDPSTTEVNETIYADTAEFAIGDDVHYQLSINAVNYERTDGDKPESVKQIKEYIIADYQNKNMVFNSEKRLKVTIVKKDKDGNIVEPVVAGPIDYTDWVTAGYFFVNEKNEDWTEPEGDDKSIFANATNGGIVIPWVEKVTEEQAASLSNVTTNVVFTAADDDDGINEEAYTALTADEKAEYFKNNEDGKYYKKIPVAFERKAGEIKAGDKLTVNGTVYDVVAGADETVTVTIDGVVYTIGEKYLTDASGNKLQAKTNDGELIWETEKAYFHSLYPDDVTIIVDYWMTLTDTAAIDGDGNINYSQFGVDYVEEGDRDYEYDSDHTPQDNPPDEPKKPTETKDKDDATVFTYAIAIKKIDENGNALVGAEFQIRGVKSVTQKSDGWYKVDDYNYSDTEYYQDANMKTDKNGMLVVDGFQTKWVLDVLETKAPEGYNRLTDPVKIQPIKTGSDATSTSTVITYDENGEVTSTTTETVYKKNSTVIGKTVKVNDEITYYEGESTTPLEDDAATVENGKTAKEKFEALFTDKDLLDPAEGKEAVVSNISTSIAKVEVENRKGPELPSTGGIGTTIFYAGGAILVLLAGILLVSKRRIA